MEWRDRLTLLAREQQFSDVLALLLGDRGYSGKRLAGLVVRGTGIADHENIGMVRH